jgi:Ca2+ transporting ATPase
VPQETIWELIAKQFEDEILRILCVAAAVSLVIGIYEKGLMEGWLEGFAIFVAVIIIVSVTATNDYMKEKQFRKLNSESLKKRRVHVKRAGETRQISHFDLVVGDLLVIDTGEVLPVDAIVTSCSDMLVDESAMTGESKLVHKNPVASTDEREVNPFLISGSRIMGSIFLFTKTKINLFY